ncbi:hypothetical protein C8R45DRAFT_1214356 [Mycena sanguinolenta]|nr:hypothetical protein C8R45DRAFT_1214356 [Mycena sanguinolenta]
MSVSALRFRIAQLCGAIFRSEQPLQIEALRRQKSLVQRQLNEALDPIARLPLEIASEIFLQCLLPPFMTRNPRLHVPLLLLSICNTWTSIALSTPGLWTSVTVDLHDPSPFARIWLQRAGNHPVSISVRGDFRARGIPSLVWEHGRHLKELTISHYQDGIHYESDTDSDESDYDSDEEQDVDVTLTVHNDGLRYEAFIPSQILQFLRLVPNLIDFTFGRMESSFSSALDVVSPPLQTLRRLTFGRCDRLQKPAHYSALDTKDQIFSFLKRTAPSLEELVLCMIPYEPEYFPELHESLRLVPTLQLLELWYPTTELVTAFFRDLESFPSLLPNLTTLIILPYSTLLFPWSSIIRAVSSRRLELAIVGDGIRDPPSADALASFAELVAHGAHIRIGSDKRIYI